MTTSEYGKNKHVRTELVRPKPLEIFFVEFARVGTKSIQCTVCNTFIHKKCSRIQSRLKNGMNFSCKTCLDGNPSELEVLKEIEISTHKQLKCIEKFCYLGDMIGAGGGLRRHTEHE